MSEPATPESAASESVAPEPAVSDPSLANQSLPAEGSSEASGGSTERPRKGPLSFLTGSLTSFGFAWLALQLSGRVVRYYADHPPHYEARFAQSIAVFMKTLMVGMSFLATFTFAFVGLGLLLTAVRSLMPGWSQAEESP